jgi:hypothetical protein
VPGALAQPAADFYKGKTVTLVVSSSPGGGYDIMSRTIAKYLGSHLPGNPRVLVQNMPGAGGIVAMNYFYNNAPKDGTVLGAMQNNTPFEPLLGTREAKYDPTKFNWLGSPSTEVGLIAVWRNVPVNSLADLKRRGNHRRLVRRKFHAEFLCALINETLGTKMRIVVGYPGQNESISPWSEARSDGFPSLFYNTLNATRPPGARKRTSSSSSNMGWRGARNLRGAQCVGPRHRSETELLLQAGLAEVTLGRPYLMPPNVPADRVAAMRKGLEDTFKDPAFLADSKRMSLGVSSPRTGAQIQRLIEETYRTPPQIVDRLRKLSLH